MPRISWKWRIFCQIWPIWIIFIHYFKGIFLFFLFLLLFFNGHIWGKWKFPGKGLNLNRAAAETQAAAVWFLTHWATHSMNSQRDLVSSFLQDDSLMLTKVIVQEKKQSGKNFKDLPLFSYLLDLPNISDHLIYNNVFVRSWMKPFLLVCQFTFLFSLKTCPQPTWTILSRWRQTAFMITKPFHKLRL